MYHIYGSTVDFIKLSGYIQTQERQNYEISSIVGIQSLHLRERFCVTNCFHFSSQFPAFLLLFSYHLCLLLLPSLTWACL